MDIGSAFTYMFDDPDWIKKLAIGGGIAFVGLILTPILIGLAGFFVLSGYMIEVLKNVRDGHARPLPEWGDFGELLKKGFFVAVIGFVYNIPSLIFACATQAVTIGLDSADPDVAQSLGIVFICLSCIQILFGLLAALLLPAGLIRYAQTDSLGSAFQFGELYRFIRSNLGDYIIVFLLGLVAQIIATFGVILCVVGVFFTLFWSLLVTGNLYGQLARKAQGVV
jgi:hypothetical protein